ncbi:MAG: hypothetical protein ACLRZH_19425 [Ruthenibacterium lactatiformans]
MTLKSFGPAPFSVTDPGVGEYVWNGATDAFISTTENADMVYFQYLRISFDCSGVWTAFDELTVMGKNGKCTTAGTLVGTPDGPQNLALDKPYTVSHARRTPYGDTDGKELTDASFGSTDMYDAAWQGHSGNGAAHRSRGPGPNLCGGAGEHEFPAKAAPASACPRAFLYMFPPTDSPGPRCMMKKPPQRQTACTRCNGWAARASPAAKQTLPAWPRGMCAWTRS